MCLEYCVITYYVTCVTLTHFSALFNHFFSLSGIFPSLVISFALIACIQYFRDTSLNYVFLKQMGHPRPLLSFIFGLFKQTLQFYNNICEKCPSSIRYRDSNPRPLERESPPITTRPGLPLFAYLSYLKMPATSITFSNHTLLTDLPTYACQAIYYALRTVTF